MNEAKKCKCHLKFREKNFAICFCENGKAKISLKYFRENFEKKISKNCCNN